jgi:TetR/AcrR family transcriptional regulator
MPRDPQDKINRILSAARREFARAGREGARIDAIARGAGMNKRLLYHYVGNKDALFRAVVDECVAQLRRAGPDMERVDPATWRVLCHASVEGEPSGIALARSELRHPGESSARAEIRIALAVVRALLPDLAGASAAAESRGPSAEPGLKPRVRVQPELRGVPDPSQPGS